MTFEPADILIVEDDPNDLELTLRALRANNLLGSHAVARDGEEALEYLTRTGRYADRPSDSDPKVILLDLKLPKVDGLEVAQRIKSDPVLRTIPVVMLTSSKDENDILDSFKLGVNTYIVKSFDYTQFCGDVRAIRLYYRPPAGARSPAAARPAG
jgi:CheY-like chemotaxis protein